MTASPFMIMWLWSVIIIILITTPRSHDSDPAEFKTSVEPIFSVLF